MTLNSGMAVAIRYFTKFGSFRGAWRKSVWRYTDTFCGRILTATFVIVTENECVMHRRWHVNGCHHYNITYLLLLPNSTARLILSWWNFVNFRWHWTVIRWKFPIDASCYWPITANWVTTSFWQFSAYSERPTQLNSTQLNQFWKCSERRRLAKSWAIFSFSVELSWVVS